MGDLLKNWRTGAAGLVLVSVGVLSVFGVHVPGFTGAEGTAIATGLGLILAKDGATHSTTEQVRAADAAHS